ncbi:hypothetical protein SAMN05421736_13320 [Evansella caseinilytica]|uniref:ABC-2 family transporter n=1 Tax=Evansella caseinilytica TaxID=1503961 RepID=A0A1H3V0Q1_9BACI|nr:hypothetical protein [Evansella caseinilytica]SDZ68270.1 hypothetical protein SAMN05421736_13320 [Evansella caseinilytica]
MRYFKLIKYDLKNGFQLGLIKLLIVALLAIIFCIDFYFRKSNVYFFNDHTPPGTFIDYLFYMLAGMRDEVSAPTEGVKWLLLQLFILYSTLYYPHRDLSSLGLSILVRTKKRSAWWVSKSIWIICYTLGNYLVIFLTVFVFCLVMQEPISLNITSMFVRDILDVISPYDTFSPNLVYIIAFLPMIISIALNLFQMTLVLFIKPLYSFGVTAVIILASVYQLHPFLPSNYAMPIRSEYVIENGMQASDGIAMAICLLVISIIVGCLYFRHYDILNVD